MIRRELLSMKKIMLTAAVCLGVSVPSQGQVSLTIEKAMDIAEEHSPSPTPFPHEPGTLSAEPGCTASFPEIEILVES